MLLVYCRNESLKIGHELHNSSGYNSILNFLGLLSKMTKSQKIKVLKMKQGSNTKEKKKISVESGLKQP